jgi:hypothetical protein
MNHSLEIQPEAEVEIDDAYLYYEDKRIGLGKEFLDHLDHYLQIICEYPKHFPVKNKKFREAYLIRFPYLVIYEIEKNKVVVYSVFNTPQNPKKKPK